MYGSSSTDPDCAIGNNNRGVWLMPQLFYNSTCLATAAASGLHVEDCVRWTDLADRDADRLDEVLRQPGPAAAGGQGAP